MSNSKKKCLSLSFIFLFLVQIWSPTMMFALTEGPGQPEMISFQPIGMDNMVNLFSGDFNYNLPLLNVPGPDGGYPINLHYNSTIGMEQEASWVGLGWNVNVGSVNRVTKGLPDDFNGTPVIKRNNVKTNFNIGLEIKPEAEILSTEIKDCVPPNSIQKSMRFYYDNFVGLGSTFGYSTSFSANSPIGLDLSFGTNEGVNFSPSMSLAFFKGSLGFNTGVGINSRSGIQKANYSISVSKQLICSKTNSTKDFASGGGFGASTISYLPTAQLGFRTVNASIGAKLGTGAIFATKGVLAGDVSRTWLKDEYRRKKYNAFGYQYSQNTVLHSGGDEDKLKDELMDFNLEKEGIISKHSPNAAAVIPTGDVYSASSQGFSGTFNSYRNDHGYYYSPEVRSNNYGGTITGDFSAGAGVDIGAEIGLSYSDSYSGPIGGDIFQPGDNIDFNGKSGFAEGHFLKDQDGHNSVQDPAAYKKNSDEPNRFKISQGGAARVYETLYEGYDYEGSQTYSDFTDKQRENSNDLLKSYTQSELNNYSDIMDPIHLWNWNDTDPFNPTQNPLPNSKGWSNNYSDENLDEFTDNYNADDQVGAFVSIGSNGMLYEYGIPVYNNYQKEAVFSTDYLLDEESSQLDKTVPYNQGQQRENSVSNSSGEDHFFQSTELPPYAHTHLLTAMYSPDYVDLTSDGPTTDDLGYYVKFNYAETTDDFKWRVPFFGANNMPGHLSNKEDNKANYTYGSKEIYYLKSIETRTHLAEFIISPRADGMEANNENQTSAEIGSDCMYKLDKIKLYSRNNPDVAIQTIHFEYSYELCPGVLNFNDNNQVLDEEPGSGKLTLKKIYTTNYESQKGMLSPYEFDYGPINGLQNPDYDEYNKSKMDHWGNYSGRTPSGYGNQYYGANTLNPYTNQKDDYSGSNGFEEADVKRRSEHASAWLIRSISLPSGGKINVDYESDDYAYVQNKKAKQLFKITGFSKTVTGSTTDEIEKIYQATEGYFVHVELDNHFENDEEDDALEYWNNCVEECDDIYFKTYIKLKKPVASGTPAYDYVKGYAHLDASKFDGSNLDYVYQNSGKWYGIVPIKTHDVVDYIHPFQLAGFNQLRYERPDLFRDNTNAALAIPALVLQLIGAIPESMALLIGYNNVAKIRGWSNKADLDNPNFPSFLRLQTGDGKKYGGGHRVKQIEISDEWSNLSNNVENSSKYHLNYHYTLADGKTSSGVATYEPRVGGEENALKEVKRYKAGVASLDKNLWLEYPINENLYPQANVGYGRVQVESTGSVESQDQFYSEDDLGIDQRLKSAKIVHEFYTFKDFPIKSKQTSYKRKKQFPPVIPIPCFGSMSFSNSIVSQGYSIELNDMHGKMKAVKTYHSTVDLTDDSITPYAKTEYEYRKQGNELDNSNLPFFHPEQGISYNGVMGRSVEVATYINENRMIGTTGSNVDGDVTMVGLPLFSIWLKADYTEAHTRLITTNKIIRKQGIIDRVITTVGDSRTEAVNLAYDKKTGSPVVVKQINNFDDPIYISSIPAHWHYEDFNPTKESNGFIYLKATSAATVIDDGLELPSEFFDSSAIKVGDKLKVNSDGGTDVLYVSSVDLVNNTLNMVNASGQTVSEMALFDDGDDIVDYLRLEIIETNKNNMLGTQVGSVVSLVNPLDFNVFGSNWISDINGAIQSATPHFSGDLDLDGALRCEQDAPPFGDIEANVYCADFETSDTCGSEYTGKLRMIKRDGYLEIVVRFQCAEDGDAGCLVPFYQMSLYFDDISDAPTSNAWHDFSNTYLQIDENANLFELMDTQNQENDELYGGLDINPAAVGAQSVKDYFVRDCPVEVLQARAMTLSDQWNYDYNDPRITQHASASDFDDNPYRLGKRGNYRAKSSYVYQAPRTQHEDQSRISEDGVFLYYPFKWCQDFDNGCDIDGLNPDWTKASTMTKYDPFNNALEETDALDISSSVLFSRDKDYLVAQAANAKHQEIAFEDFEESVTYLPGNHLNFQGVGSISAVVSHSGKNSMQLNLGETLSIDFNENILEDVFKPLLNPSEERKKYLLSFWTKSDQDASSLVSMVGSIATSYIQSSSDDIYIEGWKKIDVIVDFEESDEFQIRISNSTSSPIYIDDIRIHPYEASFNSFVYDYNDARHLASLDNRNYTTFYNYDELGMLTQVKQETVRGVVTVQTSRSNTRKIQ